MQKKIEKSIINPFYMLFWLCISLWLGMHHELFGDEAQAYLIARDASVSDIFTTVSRTEGTPALWFLWVKFLIFCGLDYSKLYLSSIIPNFIAVYIFISKAPFSKYIRYLLPLTYFILYQYNIVSRNYSLLFLAICVVSICFEKRKEHPFRLIFSLLLLGSVTSHAFLLSCSIVVFWIYKDAMLKEGFKGYREFITKNIKPLSCFGIFVILSVLYLYPESSNQYLHNYELIQGYRFQSIFTFLSSGLVISSEFMPRNIGFIYLGISYFLIMIILMSQNYKWSFWILFFPNILFMMYVPYKPWHAGIILMTGIFLFWHNKVNMSVYLKVGIGILLCVQVIWSISGVIKEIKGKYAISEDIHTFLQSENISASEIKLAAFNGISLHLYTNRPELSYWDWRRYGFTQKITAEDIKNKRAIIINQEVYEKFNDRVQEIQQQGNYQIKVFKSAHFFALQDMSKDETLYVLYRK